MQYMNVPQGRPLQSHWSRKPSANFNPEELAIAQGNLSVKSVFSSLLCPFDFRSPRKQEYDEINIKTMTMAYFNTTSFPGI